MKNQFIINGKKKAIKRIILAHGAGAAMDSEWMEELTKKLVKRDIQVIRFNFPYMIKAQEEGKKYPPSGKQILLESWERMIEKHRQMGHLFIGGKSLGGRMASLIADGNKVDGLVCLGFPFHAPGKSIGDRAEHLKKMKTPTIILQGKRDSMGSFEELKGLRFARKVKINWVESGDHSFKPLKSSGLSLDDNLEYVAEAVDQFMIKVLGL